jgi:hypothetical protein
MSFGYSTSFLNVFAMLSILLGIFIIITKNPIISVYCNLNKYCNNYTIMMDNIYIFILSHYKNPSAGIGRQGKFKLCWCIS